MGFQNFVVSDTLHYFHYIHIMLTTSQMLLFDYYYSCANGCLNSGTYPASCGIIGNPSIIQFNYLMDAGVFYSRARTSRKKMNHVQLNLLNP